MMEKGSNSIIFRVVLYLGREDLHGRTDAALHRSPQELEGPGLLMSTVRTLDITHGERKNF